ncbi:MAG: hypothetical protein WA584_11255 [Pyrinomonadaceae bacterium]
MQQQYQYVYLLCNGSAAANWLDGMTANSAVALAPSPNSLAYSGFSGTQWSMTQAVTPKGEPAVMFETIGGPAGNRILYGNVDVGQVQLAPNPGENETMWLITQNGTDPLGNVPTYTILCADRSFGNQFLNGSILDGSVNLIKPDIGGNLPTTAFWFIFGPAAMS